MLPAILLISAICVFEVKPQQDQHITFETALARGFAATIMDSVPDDTAWAMELHESGSPTSTLAILDANGCLIGMGQIDASLWTAVFAIIRHITRDEPPFFYPWDAPPWTQRDDI